MFDQTVVQVYQGQKDGLGPRISDFPDEDDFVGTDRLCDIVGCILRLPMENYQGPKPFNYRFVE